MPFGFLSRLAVGLNFALIVAVGRQSCALEPATPLNRLARQSWSIENGLPQNSIPVMLQSHSGYLWVGTELGLARFDGVGFRVFDHAAGFPDSEIRCMLDAASGAIGDDLWIGTGDGLARLVNGRVSVLTTRDGLPSNSIRGLAQTADGAVWVWTESGLARWDGSRLAQMPSENGLPGAGITSMASDGTGGLWVATASVAVFRDGHWHTMSKSMVDTNSQKNPRSGRTNPKETALVVAATGGDVLISDVEGIFIEHQGSVRHVVANESLPADGVTFLAQLTDGTVVATSNSSAVMVSQDRIERRFVVGKELPGSRIETVFADRQNSLWVGTNRGMARIHFTNDDGQPSPVQMPAATDPLAVSAVMSFLEDREGDIWVGTETAGLHILRDARFRTIGSGDGLNSDATTAIVQDAHGTVWTGTRDNGLNRVGIASDGTLKVSSMTTSNGLLSNVILSLAAASNGDVWVGTPDGLSRIAGNSITSFTSAEELPDDFIRSLLVAPDDSLWIGTRRGLTHLDHGRFQNMTRADGLGSDLVGALARGADGDVWIATLNGLSRLHDGRVHNYTTADGLSSNVITALDATPNGMIWIGSQDGGLNLWDGKRFTPLHEDGAGRLPRAIHAVIHDDRGHLWLASDSGLARVDMSALASCTQSAPCQLNGDQLATFTTADGLRSRSTSSNSHPTALRARDGELWFTTPRGVIVADPQHFAASPPAPPVVIERFAVDDKEVQPSALSRIKAGHLRFQFDYAGLSFAAAQKVRYAYMLQGFDHAWTDAGARRTAYYTNIPPGNYHFRVRAMFGDDEPSSAHSEALLSFELQPHFYQTIWFRALMILLIAGLVVIVFRRRLMRVQREFQAVMGERNRIAREIHDTLAQGYVGISLQLEILGELLRHNRTDAAAKQLTITQGLVREGLDDARQSIWALRSQDATEQTLPVRLRRLVEQAEGEKLKTSLDVHGAYRAFAPEIEQEILRVAQEAIQNVKKHAEASDMVVRLDYDERALELSVVDDGKGFVVTENAHGMDEGHYGLTGIRERAALIQGEIELISELGRGTTIRLRLPLRRRAGASHESESAITGSKE